MSARTATLAAMEPNPSVVAPPLTSEPSEADAIAAEEKELQGSCKRFVVSHGVRTAGEMLESIGAEVDKDSYGEGGVVAELEEEVAELLAKPAAVFLPTGTMAQQATLRVHADRRGRSTFVAHPACHLDWREGRGYQRLHGLSMRQAGELRRPLSASDLAAVGEAPAALLIELPQRDLGGRLPDLGGPRGASRLGTRPGGGGSPRRRPPLGGGRWLRAPAGGRRRPVRHRLRVVLQRARVDRRLLCGRVRPTSWPRSASGVPGTAAPSSACGRTRRAA